MWLVAFSLAQVNHKMVGEMLLVHIPAQLPPGSGLGAFLKMR